MRITLDYVAFLAKQKVLWVSRSQYSDLIEFAEVQIIAVCLIYCVCAVVRVAQSKGPR
jgi:hypothetical protein